MITVYLSGKITGLEKSVYEKQFKRGEEYQEPVLQPKE